MLKREIIYHTASFEDPLLLGKHRYTTVYTVPLNAITLVEVLRTKFQ